jgi:hypothetical protein
MGLQGKGIPAHRCRSVRVGMTPLSPGHAVRPENREVIQRFAPVMNGHGLLFRCRPQSEKRQLQRRVFIGKPAAGFDDLAQRAIQRLDAVGSVDRPANVGRVVEKRRDPGPVPLSHLAHAGVGFPPAFQFLQAMPGLGHRRRTIDRLQIGGHRLAQFPKARNSTKPAPHARCRAAPRCTDTPLRWLPEILSAIHTGNENVLHSPILQVRQYLQPELRSFRLRHP